MKFYTVEELADTLHVSPEHIRRKIRDGVIPIVPDDVSNKKLIPGSVVEKWDMEWMLGTESFGERKSRMELEALRTENQKLRKILVEITQIGMEGMK